MYERILLPLDGSPGAEAVLPYVVELAHRFGSQVVIFQAVKAYAEVLAEARPAGGLHSGEVELTLDVARRQAEAESRAAEAYLESIRQQLVAQGISRVEAVVREGRPERVILEYAKETGVALVAMSTHGRSGLTRLIAGSIADSVLRESHLPVLLVRPEY